MDPQPTTPFPNAQSSPSHLLIKFTNPFTTTQQTDPHNNNSPKDHSPTTFPSKTSKEDQTLIENSSKDLEDDSLEESGSGEDNLEDSAQKSNKRVYTKRTTDKIRRWTKEESKLYEDFIDMYSDIFNDSSSKRVTKIFIFMANYIGSKTPSQCRSHHQKFFRRIQREKLLSSGKATNEEELEKLMPKKRKKKTEKNKENQDEISAKPILAQQITQKSNNEASIAENEVLKQESQLEPNGNLDLQTMNNGPLNNEFYQDELEQNNELQHQQQLNFIENDGYGKMIDAPSQFMNLKRNYEAFRKLSIDDKEWMTLFNNKTRRKSSISMLFNNNYFYQTDPELYNLEFMHKPQNFPEESLGNYPQPPPIQQNGYGNYPPPNGYYYNNYPPPLNNNGYTYPYDPNNINNLNNQHNNEEYQAGFVNEDKDNKGLNGGLKGVPKPVIENQQILWNNAMDNVDVIEKYLRTVGEKS